MYFFVKFITSRKEKQPFFNLIVQENARKVNTFNPFCRLKTKEFSKIKRIYIFKWSKSGQNLRKGACLMSKRGENIHKRKDGRWEARILDNNRNKYKSIYAGSYSELKSKIRNTESYKSKTKKLKTLTVKDLSEEWLKQIEIKTKQSTTAKYTHTIKNHILPYLGKINISELNCTVINEFIREKTANGKLDKSGGLSPKTIRDIISILNQMLRFAQTSEYIAPVKFDIPKPRTQEQELKALTPKEQEMLVRYVKNHINAENSGILIALYTGVRLGELCALQWKDIDFELSVIKITKTIQRIQNTDKSIPNKTRIIIDTPKSKKSMREIPIPDFIYDLL